MTVVAQSWILDVERGPGWLFVHLAEPHDRTADEAHLAEMLWALVEQHFIYRVVLEFGATNLLTSTLVGQLLSVERKLHEHGGTLRLCGLSEHNQQTLKQCRLDARLPHFHDRSQAVLGRWRPLQPR